MQIPGRGINWQFARSYRSGVQFDSPLGRNWDLNYNRRLWLVTAVNQADVNLTFGTGVAKPGDVVRIDGSNRPDLYVYNSQTQTYTDPSGFFTVLTKTDSTHFRERDAHGMVYTYLKPPNSDVAFLATMADPNGDTMQFLHQQTLLNGTAGGGTSTTLNDGRQPVNWLTDEWAGQSVRINSGAGAGQVRTIVRNTAGQLTVSPAWDSGNVPDYGSTYSICTPNQGPLSQVIDTLGRAVNYQYDIFGHLTAIQDFTGRTLRLRVDNNDDLVQVTSPAIVATPNGNDFPIGKTVAYGYSSRLGDDRLNHELETIIAPNEFAVGGDGGTPRLTVTYDTEVNSATVARVQTQYVGGTNALNVPAGGLIQYAYYTSDQLPTDANPNAVSQTEVTNRNGNVTAYQFNSQGDIVRTRVLTDATRIPRANQPAFFQTDSTFNADHELLTRIYPEGNSVANLYDSTNADRYEQGNLLRTTQNPGSRGGDQTTITVSYTYEPIYNQIRTVTDPRGTDPAYRPPIALAGEVYPAPQRYQTVYTYDYQEGTNYAGLAGILGMMPAQVQQLLANANVPMGLGDVNRDNRTNQIAGNLIRVDKPSAHLLPTANQSNISASVLLRGQAADGNTAQILNAQNQSWTDGQWAGKAVEITGGLGAGQVRTITANGANQLRLYSPWVIIPDHTSTFAILTIPSEQGGLSTGGSTSTLSDTNQDWVPLQWTGQLLEITGGSQAGQVRTIVSNTANQLTVTPPWPGAPESGSAYRILPSSLTQGIAVLNAYNSYGLLTKTVDAEGNVSQNAYYPVTSPGSGTAFDDRQGGYLARAFQDTASAAGRDNGTNPMPANVTLGYTYDPMGNVISQTDGRGIETDYSVNQLNQVVQLTKAANVPTQINTAEPLPLTQYQYLQRNFYDFNNDLVLSQVEDRGNTVNVAGEPFAQELPSFLVYATNQVSRGPNTSTTITTAPQSYTPDALIGKTVQITTDTAGSSRGEVRTIVGNSDRMITIDAATPWSPIPSPGAFFAILNIPAPFALVSGGQATGAGASTLSDSKQQWDDLTGRFVEITGGTGAGQVRVITSNTPTQLTLASAWARQPDTMSTYAILALAHDGTAFVDTVYKYDILDQKIETLQEASSGVPSSEFVRTRYRYDPNGNQVLTIYPEGNASASIYDERDLLFQSITGATAPPPQALWIRTYPPDPTNYNVRGGLPATTTFNYDGNRNLTETVAADDTDGSLANNAKAAAGTSTGSNTATTLNDTTQHWLTNQWQGQTVLVVSRTGANQVATIVSNTATQLTVTPAWTTTPDNTWVYSFPGKSFSTGGNTDTTLNDTTQQWMPNQWAGRTVRIVAGTGASQVATVAANTPTQLQLTPATAWGITPDETSMYAFQGDRTRFIYDGFDRKTSAIDSLGNQTVKQYDPAGNLVRVTQLGPVGGGSPTRDGPDTLARPVSSGGVIQFANLVNTTLLAATETSYDELSRAFQTDQVLFVNTSATKRLPDVADGAADIGKGNINPGATQPIPGAIQTLATGRSTGQMNDATHLTDTIQTWTSHQFQGASVKITAGTGMGQVRLIQDNSANQVTVSLPWTVVPDNTSQYVIQNVVILGRVSTRTEYDRASRLTFTVQDDGDTSRTDYDGLGRVIKTADPEGNTVQTAYDADSNVIETSQTDVSQVAGVANEVFLTTTFYDSLNRPQETVDNLGEATYRRYDSLNNLVAVADANGPASGTSIMRRFFAAGSRTVNTTNAFGNVTLSYYDGLGRKTRTEVILTASHQGDGTHAGADADGVIRTSGDPTQITIPTPDPSQGGGDGLIRTGYLWDQNSLQVGMFDDQGNLTVSLYDNLNRQVVDVKGLVGTSALTQAALLGSRTIPTPTVATLNNPATIANTLISSQLTALSSRVRAVAVQFPRRADQLVTPAATITGLDPDNNALIGIDPNGTAVYTKYDAINRPLDLRVFRAGQNDSFAGDPLFAPNPANLPPAGPTTVVGTTKQDFEYDGLSRRTAARDNNDPIDPNSASLVTDAYDSLGRVIEENQQVGTRAAQVVSSSWRAANLRSQLTYPSGRTEQYRYDHLERVQAIYDSGVPVPLVSYAYIGPSRLLTRQVVTQAGTPAHTLTETYLDGAGTDAGYDGLGRPTHPRTWRETGTLVTGFDYVYDRLGNKISQRKLHALNDSELYIYDSAYRLLTLQRGTLNADGTMIVSQTPDHAPHQSSWTLDGAGNFQQVSDGTNSVSRTFSSTNALVSVGSTTHAFDSDGNETNDGTYQFSWDFANRLQTVKQLVGDQLQLIASYAYNADGQRDRQVVINSGAFNGETDFYLDGADEIEDHNATDAIVKQYVHGADVNEPVLLDLGGTTRYFYSQDELGSVYALTDAAGGIKEGYLYDAYGQQTVFTPGPSGYVTFTSSDGTAANGISALGNDFLFTGMHFDAQTAVDSLYYVRARYYNAVEARFVSWDPEGYGAGDSNLYAYTGENPTNEIDPSGLEDRPANPRLIDYSKLSSMRCAQCHGDPQGYFKNIAVGGAFKWSDLAPEQRNMLQLQSTYRPGVTERGVTRFINNVSLGPLSTAEGVFDAYLTGRDEGAPPVVAALGAPFYAVAKAIQGLELSVYLLATGQGSIENAVDVGTALLPFLPKLARWGKASGAARPLESFRAEAEAILARNRSLVRNLIMEDPGQWETINPLEVQDRLIFREMQLDRLKVDAKLPFDLELAANPNVPIRIVKTPDGNLHIMKGNKRMMAALESNAESARVKVYTVEQWEQLTEGRFVPRGTNNPLVK